MKHTHTRARARGRNIKKHFEETKAQRGENRNDCDSLIGGTIRGISSNSPREIGNAIRMNSRWPRCSFAGGATTGPLNSLYFLSKQTVKTAEHLGEAERDARRNRPFIVDHENSHGNPSVHVCWIFLA